jgi:hypothetical protein
VRLLILEHAACLMLGDREPQCVLPAGKVMEELALARACPGPDVIQGRHPYSQIPDHLRSALDYARPRRLPLRRQNTLHDGTFCI